MVPLPPVLAAERASAPVLSCLPPAASALAVLAPRGCRWPLGEPAEADFSFCGALRLLSGSYCAVHARLAHAHARASGTGARP